MGEGAERWQKPEEQDVCCRGTHEVITMWSSKQGPVQVYHKKPTHTGASQEAR